jgi:hypothetical protein
MRPCQLIETQSNSQNNSRVSVISKLLSSSFERDLLPMRALELHLQLGLGSQRSWVIL